MREIKARIWSKLEKKMLSPLRLCFESSTVSILEPGRNEVFEYQFASAKNPDGYPIMFFTGLLDKNGKEIYEGDILGTSISDCYAGPIFWDDKKAGFHTELDLPVSCIEIIGNIYEHSHSLTK